jgi:hypothetical protein
VKEKMTFADYWGDRRFRRKRPSWGSKRIIDRCGDNCYEPAGRGGYKQHPSGHWDHDHAREDEVAKQHDTRHDAVLVSRKFVYFGRSGPELPGDLSFLRVGRGHRSRFSPDEIALTREFFDALPRGVRGRPARWPEADTSWSARCG